jgi:isopenicillin N synthase-like dioxygenase
VTAIPVIDVAPLLNGSAEQMRAVAQELGSACRDVGFFYVTGHGIPPELVARVFTTSAAFFAASASVRNAASFSGPGDNRGYIKLGGETLDPGKPADVKEAFNIGLELAPDDPELLARAPFRAANLWPEIPGFRDIGDCLMRWSNDVYVSTPHKVVSPPNTDRYSVAFFLDPNPDALVACLPTCTNDQRPAKYPPVTGAEFLRSRLEPTYVAKA